MGHVSEVHCLHSTSVTSGMASVGKVTYYNSSKELVNFALSVLNMETSQPKNQQQEQNFDGTTVTPPPPTAPCTVIGQEGSNTQPTVAIPIATPVEGK